MLWTWRTIPRIVQAPNHPDNGWNTLPIHVMVEAEELGPRVTGHMDAQEWRDAGRMADLLRFYSGPYWREAHGFPLEPQTAA